VVETHATPLGLGPGGRPLTMVTEATIAYSDRPGFQVARWPTPLLRPGIRRTARKLWLDDLAYAGTPLRVAATRRVSRLTTLRRLRRMRKT